MSYTALNRVLCPYCREVLLYRLTIETRVREIYDCRYEHQRIVAHCEWCKNEVSVPGLDDFNEQLLKDEYDRYCYITSATSTLKEGTDGNKMDTH